MYVQLHKGRHKPLYTHFTCATDTENIRVVFNSVKDTIFLENMSFLNLEWGRMEKCFFFIFGCYLLL